MSFSDWLKRIVGAAIILVPGLLPIALPAEEAPPTPPEKWSMTIRDASDCTPAIGRDGTIYFGTFSGKLWAIGPDGAAKWIFRAPREIKSSCAVGPDGTIYFGCRDRNMHAVGSDGREKWAYKTGAWVDSSPALGEETVYFGSWDKSFYALTTAGALKWQFKTGGPIVSSPAIGSGGRLLFGSHDGKFYALAPDGTKAWEFVTRGAIISSPALGRDGEVYFTSVDGALYALNAEGALLWRLKTGGVTASSPVIGQDGTIYVGVNEKLWAVHSDGKKKWEQPYSEPIEAAPMALKDGSVCFVSGSGQLINLDVPHKFKWQRFMAVSTASPAVSTDGAVLAFGGVVNVGYVLYALKTNAPLADSPWPKFRGNPQNTGR